MIKNGYLVPRASVKIVVFYGGRVRESVIVAGDDVRVLRRRRRPVQERVGLAVPEAPVPFLEVPLSPLRSLSSLPGFATMIRAPSLRRCVRERERESL